MRLVTLYVTPAVEAGVTGTPSDGFYPAELKPFRRLGWSF